MKLESESEILPQNGHDSSEKLKIPNTIFPLQRPHSAVFQGL